MKFEIVVGPGKGIRTFLLSSREPLKVEEQKQQQKCGSGRGMECDRFRGWKPGGP